MRFGHPRQPENSFTKAPTVEIRKPITSAVFVQRVPSAQAQWFLEWQRGISVEAEKFAGYLGTDVYPPQDREKDHWVVVIHFDKVADVDAWMSSEIRRRWLKKLDDKISHFDLQVLPGGFGPWFLKQFKDCGPITPPPWKMFLTVLLGLYPTVMLLTIFISPYTQTLGQAWGMLIGNVLSVAILQWAVLPVLDKLLARWLNPGQLNRGLVSGVGALIILMVLSILAFLFQKFSE